MASPPTSLSVSSEEICNGTKLRRLLLDGGTPALRRVLDGFHPPSRLAAALNVERQTLETLLKKRVLKRTQWNQLFPTDGVCVDSGAFDITLLIILLTNICGLRRPRKGWNDKPPSSDTSREANIVRLRYYRNKLSHPANGSAVSSQDFEVYWQEIADALVAFGEDRNAIDALKAEPGGINVLDKLEMCDFTAEIEYHTSTGRFQNGTRDWVFNDVEVWLNDRQSQHQVMAITGDAGMGKTVVSAVICKRMQEADRLSGSHFCQHNFPRYRNPKLALQSLAFQLSCNVRGYKEALVKRISRNFGDELSSLDVNDLFALLFEEPLSSVADPGRNVLIVIDGLDESEDQGKNELVDVIANHFHRLPRWIRLLVTTRPEKKILDKMRSVKSLELRHDDERNHRDIEVFFERRICDRATPEETSRIIRELVQLSEGQMLHAYFLLELLEKSTSPQTPEQLRSTFPHGISAIYTTYFKRMEAKLEEELKSNCGKFLTNFLCVLTATRDPLPKEFVTEILRQNINISENDRLNVQRKLDSVISCISSLLPIRDGNVHIFHKSVKEWLTDKSRHGSHEFTMLEKDGHRILGKICATELDKLRANNVQDAPFSDIQKYALRHGSHHMLDALDDFNQLEELVKKYVTDLELVYAKLCAKSTDVLKELLLVQEHRSYSALSEETVGKIESLQLPFKKHGSLLQELPHVIFQNVLNEGGSELSREVLQLLTTKHLEIPYMELLEKSDYKSPVKARFYCSDKVVCFDVSPDGEHMVCEGRDGTIHLWSLQTGEQKWQRVNSWESNKSYGDVPFGTAFRRIGRNGETGDQTLSFYRSTVFHPNGQYILPGNMANVYNLSGQPTSLFPESKCRFTACAFSGDKNRMLTDCPTSRKEVVVWNTESGAEIKRFKWAEDINSFALSPDGNLVAISDSKGSLLWYNVESSILAPELVPTEISNEACGLLHITTKRTLVCGSIGNTHSDRRDVYKLKRNVFDSAFVANHQPHCTCNSKVWLWPWESVNCLDRMRAVCKVYHNFVSSEVMIGFCFLLPGDAAVVGSPTVNYLTMLNVAPTTHAGKIKRTVESTFAWDATHVYTTVTTNNQKDFSDVPCLATVSVREVNSARDVRAEKSVQLSNARVNNGRLTSPVERGVLLQTTSNTLELWNCSLSECVKSMTMPSEVLRLISVSKELVGCVLQTSFSKEEHLLTLSVIDVCSMKVAFERVLDDRTQLKSVACSIQRDVVFCKEQEASDERQLVLYKDEADMFTWNRDDTIYKGDCNWRQPHCVFSPNGKVVVTWNTLNDGYGLHVLVAGTGRKSHVFLESRYDIADCKFLNDGESVVCRRFNDSNVWMFNVVSGLVLAVIDVGERPTCIGSSPNESLIAVGLRFSIVKLIRAQLPRKGRTCVRRTRAPIAEAVQDVESSSAVTSNGGLVSVKGVKLICPPGAVDDPVAIKLILEESHKYCGLIVNHGLENDLKFGAPIINCQPNGQMFKKHVKLLIAVDSERENSIEAFLVLHGTPAEGGKIYWEDLTRNSKFDLEIKELSVNIDHFSVIAVLVRLAWVQTKEIATRLNLISFKYMLSVLFKSSRPNLGYDELAFVFMSRDIYREQFYREHDDCALMKLKSDGFEELCSNVRRESGFIYNNENLQVSVQLGEDYKPANDQQERITFVVDSSVWWSTGHVVKLSLQASGTDAKILCGRIVVEGQHGHVEEDHFCQQDLCGYVRRLLGVENAIFNIKPLTLKLGLSKKTLNEAVTFEQSEAKQLKMILLRWREAHKNTDDFAVLRKALEGLQPKDYRVKERGQMHIEHLRELAVTIVGLQNNDPSKTKSLGLQIKTLCSSILRDCCIEMATSKKDLDLATSTEKCASLLESYSQIRQIPGDIAEKCQLLFMTREESTITTDFLVIVPQLVQTIKEIFRDEKVPHQQSGLRGIRDDTALQKMVSNIQEAAKEEKLSRLFCEVSYILEHLCLNNNGNRSTENEIHQWGSSNMIITMLQFLGEFFQSPEEQRLHKRLQVFSFNIRDIMSNPEGFERNFHRDFHNVVLSLLKFAKFDPSQLVRFELSDPTNSYHTQGNDGLKYDKPEEIFSQQFWIGKESDDELQLEAIAHVHIHGRIRSIGAFESLITLPVSCSVAIDRVPISSLSVAVRREHDDCGNLRITLYGTQKEKISKALKYLENELGADVVNLSQTDIKPSHLKMRSFAKAGTLVSLRLVHKWESEKLVLDSNDFVTLADSTAGGASVPDPEIAEVNHLALTSELPGLAVASDSTAGNNFCNVVMDPSNAELIQKHLHEQRGHIEIHYHQNFLSGHVCVAGEHTSLNMQLPSTERRSLEAGPSAASQKFLTAGTGAHDV